MLDFLIFHWLERPQTQFVMAPPNEIRFFVKREIIQLAQLCVTRWCLLLLYSTGSVRGGTGWYWVVPVEYGAVLVGTWWYWVSRGRCFSLEGGTVSVEGGTGWYLVVLCQYWAVLLEPLGIRFELTPFTGTRKLRWLYFVWLTWLIMLHCVVAEGLFYDISSHFLPRGCLWKKVALIKAVF